MHDAAHIRHGFGLLTLEETVDRYGIDPVRINDAIATEELGSVTFEFAEGTRLILVPTSDGAVSDWLESNR